MTSPIQLTVTHTVERSLAANDCVADRPVRARIADLNVLVASMVGQVSGRLQPTRVNIDLRLDPNRPMARGNPTEVGFAVSGMVSTQMRALEEGDGGQLRVETRMNGQNVRVVIMADTLPALEIIRAVTTRDARDRGVDRTVAHCRRLIEAQGGTIELIEESGMLGFALVFPTVLVSRTTPIATMTAQPLLLRAA